MAPIRKLNENLEGLINERYSNLSKVKRRDYHDSGGAQRQFHEIVEEFNSEEHQESNRDKGKDKDRVEVSRDRTENEPVAKETSNRRASFRISVAKGDTNDDEPVGGKLDINA